MAIRRNRSHKRGGGNEVIGGWNKLTPMQEALLREVDREISIVSNGRSETTHMGDIVMRKLMQMAANGGQHAISNAIYQINLAQRINQQNIDERVARGREYKAMQQHRLDDARKHGRDLDLVLPHPDDIVIQEDVGYEVIGPFDETELRAVKRNCDWRDAAILQAALEERLGPLPPAPGKEPSEHPADASAMLLMHILNNELPKRFQKSDLQIAMELMRYERFTKRELLKMAHRKWASLGRPKPRGWRLPPFDAFVSMLERVIPAMMTVSSEIGDGKVPTEVIAKKLERMIGPAPFV